jgi:hypothetical protein
MRYFSTHNQLSYSVLLCACCCGQVTMWGLMVFALCLLFGEFTVVNGIVAIVVSNVPDSFSRRSLQLRLPTLHVKSWDSQPATAAAKCMKQA